MATTNKYRPVTEAQLLEIFKVEAKKIVGGEADDTLLEYMASVAHELLSEDGEDVREQLTETLGDFLSSFLDEKQSARFMKEMLNEITIPNENDSKIEEILEPVAAIEEAISPPVVEEQTPAFYKPQWIEPAKREQTENTKPKVAVTPPPPPLALTKEGGGGGSDTDLCDTVFSMAFGGRTLLARTRLHLKKGRRYGLVGANGAGKSTLLRNLAGKRLEGLPSTLQVALVQHEADSTVPMGTGGDNSVEVDQDIQEETVTDHLTRHASLLINENHENDLKKCVEFAKAVGFDTPDVTIVSTLSGGWNMRLSLARAMMAKAELLLLDEPTNHLDEAGVAWLVKYLQTTDKLDPPVTVVVVSHDANFMDQVITDVLLLAHRQRRLEHYLGSYSDFRLAKPEVHAYLTRRTDRSGNEMMTSGDKFSLTFPAPDRLDGVSSSTKTVLRVSSVTFAYPPKASDLESSMLRVVLRNVECRLTLKSKVAVLGGNGAGKSTLVRLMVGDLLAMTGDVWKHPSLRIAYVAQHSLVHIEQHLSRTPVEYMQWRFNNAVDREALDMSALQEGGDDDEEGVKEVKRGEIENIIARRNRHGALEYEVKFVGKGQDENEWRSLARLEAEGYLVLCKRYDQVHAGKAAGLDLRPLTTAEVSRHLVDFGLDPSFSQYTKINGLSGGQKSKLVFAAAMWSKPHVLVLDEPTNYLDRETLEALKSALRRFKGAFVVVSHNRDFITGLCTEEWHVKSGRVSVVKVDQGDESGNAVEIDPLKAAEEAALIAKGAAILGGGAAKPTNGSSWAKGTQTNANKQLVSGLVKDVNGKTLSKKEQRLLEKKQKALAKEEALKNGLVDKEDNSSQKETTKETMAEKKAKREAKKLMKEGVDISKLDEKFVNGLSEGQYVKKKDNHSISLSIKELELELEDARVNAARIRGELGGYFGSIATENFTLPNPGGGVNLIEDASFVLAPGRVYGLIGRNGSGKSTLLRHLAARRVTAFPPNVSVHYVTQEVSIEHCADKCPVDVVIEADIERSLLLKDLERLQSNDSTSENPDEDASLLVTIVERLDAIEADSAKERAELLLKQLGFPKDLLSKTMSELSGGWRVRVSLASAIFARPDILLLDEPTNHLSIQAVLWLSLELVTEAWANRIVVVVSHDRFFLDEVCSDTLHLSARAKHLTPSRGNFSVWQQRRTQLQQEYAHRAQLRAEEREKLSAYASHGFKYGGCDGQINMMKMKARQVEKLDEEAALDAEDCSSLQEDIELPLTLHSGWDKHDPNAPKALDEGEVETGFIVELRNVSFGYSTDKILFENVEFNIDASSRIVLLGENGNGKTTLVKLILGELNPTVGEVRRNPHCRVAMVNQHHADQLDLSLSPLAFMKRKFPGDGSYNQDQKIRSHLAQLGVTSKLMVTPALALSGGQRSRVALAATSFERPHLLVLDEPTNNLDLEAVEALADAVVAFKGAVILVSHDQYFVSRVAKRVKVVGNGKVIDIESFEGYRKEQIKQIAR